MGTMRITATFVEQITFHNDFISMQVLFQTFVSIAHWHEYVAWSLILSKVNVLPDDRHAVGVHIYIMFMSIHVYTAFQCRIAKLLCIVTSTVAEHHPS